MNCATCKWWEPLRFDVQRKRMEPPEPGEWGTCLLIGHGYDAEYDDEPPPIAATVSSPRAFTLDSSEYWSALNTRSDFGCVDHTPKP